MKRVIIELMLGMFLIGMISIISAADCVRDSDCKVKFSACSCSNVCILKSSDGNVDCARACLIEESNKTIKACKCEDNKCVGKETRDDENETEDDEGGGSGKGRGLGQIIRNRVKAGIYTNENGDQIRVSEMAQNRLRLMVGNKSADCDNCNISEERENNKTRLKIHFSNGKDVLIKIMPNTASERALERLRLRVCNETNNCTIQLREVTKGNRTIAVYEMQVQRHAKLLWLFKIKANEKAQVDGETGEIISVKKPWWIFLASRSD